jgi:hypothetical protein
MPGPNAARTPALLAIDSPVNGTSTSVALLLSDS